jgi:beta-glucanase (GH16 family)
MTGSRTFHKWCAALAVPMALTLTGCDSRQTKPAPATGTSPEPPAVVDPSLLPPGIEAAEAKLWKLVWSDEFEGTDFDRTKWDFRYLGPRDGSMMSKDCISVGDGLLKLWVKEDKDGMLHNGMISTQKKFEPRYGTIAGRIRFPRQQGQHGSIWMQPVNPEKIPDDPARSGVEIDIIEWFGEGRKDGGTASNLYWPGMKDGKFDAKANHAGGTKDFGILPEGELPSDDFHVYSVEWSPQGYIFRMDGKETYRISEGVSQVPQYIILSLFTAEWEAPRLDRKKLPNSMDVDWVRVWQADTPPERKFVTKDKPAAAGG